MSMQALADGSGRDERTLHRSEQNLLCLLAHAVNNMQRYSPCTRCGVWAQGAAVQHAQFRHETLMQHHGGTLSTDGSLRSLRHSPSFQPCLRMVYITFNSLCIAMFARIKVLQASSTHNYSQPDATALLTDAGALRRNTSMQASTGLFTHLTGSFNKQARHA